LCLKFLCTCATLDLYLKVYSAYHGARHTGTLPAWIRAGSLHGLLKTGCSLSGQTDPRSTGFGPQPIQPTRLSIRFNQANRVNNLRVRPTFTRPMGFGSDWPTCNRPHHLRRLSGSFSGHLKKKKKKKKFLSCFQTQGYTLCLRGDVKIY
jgi:hypothetical protein